MNGRTASKSALFLIELIIMILFFSLASGICVKVFVSAHLTAVGSTELSRASLVCQSAAEAFKAGDTQEHFEALLGGAPADNGYRVDYGPDWEPLPPGEEGAYRLDMSFSQTGRVQSARLSVLRDRDDSEIYSLTVKKLSENG